MTDSNFLSCSRYSKDGKRYRLTPETIHTELVLFSHLWDLKFYFLTPYLSEEYSPFFSDLQALCRMLQIPIDIQLSRPNYLEEELISQPQKYSTKTITLQQCIEQLLTEIYGKTKSTLIMDWLYLYKTKYAKIIAEDEHNKHIAQKNTGSAFIPVVPRDESSWFMVCKQYNESGLDFLQRIGATKTCEFPHYSFTKYTVNSPVGSIDMWHLHDSDTIKVLGPDDVVYLFRLETVYLCVSDFGIMLKHSEQDFKAWAQQ